MHSMKNTRVMKCEIQQSTEEYHQNITMTGIQTVHLLRKHGIVYQELSFAWL